SVIGNSEKLTEMFGYWPSFHDAEVIDLSLSRGDVRPDEGIYIFPLLETTIHLWEMTNKVNEKGFYILHKHTLAVLQFHDVHELELSGFNHQNAIFGLSFGMEERGKAPDGSPLTPFIVVEFEPAHGMAAKFKCFRAEVVSAVPCNENGRVEKEMIK